MALPDDDLGRWIGAEETRADVATAQLAGAYRATLLDEAASPAPGDALPAGIHWCLAQPVAPLSALGPDGHPERGGFLPPVPLPRRMWAGSRIAFSGAIRVGDAVTRTSRIAGISEKQGRSGRLVFVTVAHRFATERGVAVEEEQDIVYRGAASGPEASGPAAPEPPEAEATPADAERRIVADPVLLFRYSALTFNSHRIHYDEPYVKGVEGYPGLVVHGPLQAALLLALAEAMRPDRPLRRFAFRAMRPLFGGEEIVCRGRFTGEQAAALWTGASEARAYMAGNAEW